jgi:rsbT co-antagonist protein RsbR
MTTIDADIASIQNEEVGSTQLARLLDTLIQRLPIDISVWHLEDPNDTSSFRLTIANSTSSALHAEVDMRAEVGRRMKESFPAVAEALLQRYVEVLRSGQTCTLGEISYADERVHERILLMQAIPLSDAHLCIVAEDITERKQAEEARRQAIEQEETIRAQQAMLAELSTPLIPLNERVMVMPLIGAVDSARAQQVLETLLQGIAGSGAQVAILDITGVAVVDTQVANALIRAAQAVKLLGAQVVLTGIRPEVAQTLVGLGADLSGIVTRSSLQSGIAYATGRS